MKIKPIETVYINNLNDKVSLKKINQELLKVFNKYGEIIDIQLKKNLRMKGQAFITFNSLKSAKDAIKENNNNTILFGKPLRVSYAKTLADIKANEQDIENRKNLKKLKNEQQEKQKQQLNDRKRKSDHDTDLKKSIKKSKLSIDFTKLPPNKILLLQNLSNDVNQQILDSCFENYPGFSYIRFLKVRNLAFVEFESESDSKNCLDTVDLNGLKQKLGLDIQLTYAKK